MIEETLFLKNVRRYNEVEIEKFSLSSDSYKNIQLTVVINKFVLLSLSIYIYMEREGERERKN